MAAPELPARRDLKVTDPAKAPVPAQATPTQGAYERNELTK
jgi:hypothetical protein